MTSVELYEKLKPSETEIQHGQILADGISVNLSGFYTRLIKDAARCNNYSSDVVFNINEMNESLKEYNPQEPFEPVWTGFRRHGVDGTGFILSRIDDKYTEVYSEYFALYSLNIVPDGPGWVNIEINEYWM